MHILTTHIEELPTLKQHKGVSLILLSEVGMERTTHKNKVVQTDSTFNLIEMFRNPEEQSCLSVEQQVSNFIGSIST